MSQRFLRCLHCGLPHPVDERVCSITGRPIEPRVRAAPRPLPLVERVEGPHGRLGEARSSASLRAAVPFDEIAPSASLVGQVLGGKYRAVRVIGEGGMGTVYECEHVALHRRVAIKILNAAQARKKASRARFQNEAHVAGAIGHPNICEIYDMGELEDGSPFLVMELLIGETLADRIGSEGALPFDDIVDVISQVLSGLVAAHEKGIIHRDVKPENVFLTQRQGLAPMVKLLDFGISKVAGADELHLTRTGMVMGTPYYMSPEQARGDRKLDHRVDIYAAGVMTYELLTGRRPFIAANYNALLVQILTGTPRPLPDLRPAIRDGFVELVGKAMHRDRAQRFQSAAEMQREMVALRDPGNARRIASVPPEPVPLVRPKRALDPAAQAPPRREPLARPEPAPPVDEVGSISVDLDPDLLDSGASRAESDPDATSVEIPIHVEVGHKPTAARALYQPDAALAAARASALATPAHPPAGAMVAPHHPTPMPGHVQPKTPPVRAAPSADRARPPPIQSSKARVVRRDKPARPHEPDADPLEDDDPTEVGVLPHETPARSVGERPRPPNPSAGVRDADAPIHADATERIPPERLARMHARLQTPRPRGADPRVEVDDEDPEGDAPTTLFDRRSLKLPRARKPGGARANTPARAPAPSKGDPTAPGMPPIPKR